MKKNETYTQTKYVKNISRVLNNIWNKFHFLLLIKEILLVFAFTSSIILDSAGLVCSQWIRKIQQVVSAHVHTFKHAKRTIYLMQNNKVCTNQSKVTKLLIGS